MPCNTTATYVYCYNCHHLLCSPHHLYLNNHTPQIKLLKSLIIKDHRTPMQTRNLSVLPRSESTSEFMPVDKEVEYFFASDASAVIEHTNRVIYLEVM